MRGQNLLDSCAVVRIRVVDERWIRARIGNHPMDKGYLIRSKLH